jgi:cytochrome P450
LKKELPITAYSDNNNILKVCVSNIIGLFIQSYDTGRGLLSNVLWQLLQTGHHNADKVYLHKSVIETLRFNPPVHNTRRIAADVIELNDVVIEKGDAILLVLAAANRDPLQFAEPDSYNINRANNHEHLSFGAGAHSCMATHFMVNLAVECFEYIFSRFTKVELLEPSLTYEPLVNVRLPRSMWIQLATDNMQ